MIDTIRPTLSSQIAAQSLVAHHLGTDLTQLRADRTSGQFWRRVSWLGCEGGDHIVSDWRGRQWHVDLVLGTVTLRVGVPFA